MTAPRKASAPVPTSKNATPVADRRVAPTAPVSRVGMTVRNARIRLPAKGLAVGIRAARISAAATGGSSIRVGLGRVDIARRTNRVGATTLAAAVMARPGGTGATAPRMAVVDKGARAISAPASTATTTASGGIVPSGPPTARICRANAPGTGLPPMRPGRTDPRRICFPSWMVATAPRARIATRVRPSRSTGPRAGWARCATTR